IKEYQDVKDVTLLQNGKKIKKIYHLADIHIRVLERHVEYQQVFENLYEYLQQEEQLEHAVLVICGDIFHNRDHLVYETILIFNTFIEKLTSILDVILIAGNHDVFSHGDRLDTITGIVDVKSPINNLFFLKLSGIYKYHNIDFVLSSLIYNKFIGACEVASVGGYDGNAGGYDGSAGDKEETENIKISLYHGAVSGSRLDNGYLLPPSEGLTRLQDFSGYD